MTARATVPAGTYTLRISHKGTLCRAVQTSAEPLKYKLDDVNGYQRFSLALQGNTARPEDPLRITAADRAVSGGNALVGLTWASIKGLRYRVERSPDLQTWTIIAGDVYADAATKSYTATEALSATRVYYRIREVNP